MCVCFNLYGKTFTVTALRAVLEARGGWEREADARMDGRMNDRREEGDLLS